MRIKRSPHEHSRKNCADSLFPHLLDDRHPEGTDPDAPAHGLQSAHRHERPRIERQNRGRCPRKARKAALFRGVFEQMIRLHPWVSRFQAHSPGFPQGWPYRRRARYEGLLQ